MKAIVTYITGGDGNLVEIGPSVNVDCDSITTIRAIQSRRINDSYDVPDKTEVTAELTAEQLVLLVGIAVTENFLSLAQLVLIRASCERKINAFANIDLGIKFLQPVVPKQAASSSPAAPQQTTQHKPTHDIRVVNLLKHTFNIQEVQLRVESDIQLYRLSIDKKVSEETVQFLVSCLIQPIMNIHKKGPSEIFADCVLEGDERILSIGVRF